ncbi:glycosyltransferase family 9 protein [Fimbriimonas ginsengisoli]|uniref:Lipopolysaccharide heptosyltransferase II n=1 Tax=Fimbriimonas ginsengisoli Gsoil 348 TaxID=661478 RepID=A0A068NLF3_FIMGI|nr:glycosyltransferase family 9 protein [Fimbriimonas ginsengisoli]AIE84252.1 lipopolysaccharide heptosyltransferase II [Fimbriimonas ginsengisoli Gsoil 348]
MQRFLISRLSALGDTVCSLPAAAALKKTFPECHITWTVDPRFAGIVECCTAVDEVLRVKPSLRSIPVYDHAFDAALDLQGLLKSALCIARAKADRKVGYHWQREGAALFSEKILPDPSSFHVVDQYVDVARALGAECHRADFALKPKEEDILSVRRKLKERGVVGRIMVVNAGAGWATKRWPAEHFARVIDAVQAEGVQAVLVGGKAKADRAAAAEVVARCATAPADLLGETNVSELVALIRLASVHLGGDTGSTHIAAALDTPAVGLYSITRPRRSCPYGQIDRCHYDPSGLANIQPNAVLETIRGIL